MTSLAIAHPYLVACAAVYLIAVGFVWAFIAGAAIASGRSK